MMLHVRIPKSKKRKVPKAQQAEHDAWLNSINSMSTGFAKTKTKPVKFVSPVVTGVYVTTPGSGYIETPTVSITTSSGAGAGAGAALGAGGASTALGATGSAPQPGAAVAGVQLALRQQSPEAFFQTSPLALRQLSMV